MYQWQLCLACRRKSKSELKEKYGIEDAWPVVSPYLSVLYATFLPTLYRHIPSSSEGVNFLPPRRRLLVMGSRGQIPSRTTIMGQVRILRIPGVLFEADSASLRRGPRVESASSLKMCFPTSQTQFFFGSALSWNRRCSFESRNCWSYDFWMLYTRHESFSQGYLNYRKKTKKNMKKHISQMMMSRISCDIWYDIWHFKLRVKSPTF